VSLGDTCGKIRSAAAIRGRSGSRFAEEAKRSVEPSGDTSLHHRRPRATPTAREQGERGGGDDGSGPREQYGEDPCR
jgi:hypothetical protein